MMKGFVFNDHLCVDCKACEAACIIENGWDTSPRVIFTFNDSAISVLPVVHLSLSCNHCANPVCLQGCPSGAFYREPFSGAVILDEHRCLGCNYCTWNCPYDAPKFSDKKRVMEKCNLCITRLTEGIDPACSSACPTGALKFDLIPDVNFSNPPAWFPEKKLEPAILFAASRNRNHLKITPEPPEKIEFHPTGEDMRKVSTDWSLILFTFLVTCSVGYLCSSFIKGIPGNPVITLVPLCVAAIASLFHLGHKLRALKAIINLKSSPLSREILLFIIYSSSALIYFLLGRTGLILLTSFIGLILLVTIDSVYYFSDESIRLKFHSGQTFISGLLIASLLSDAVTPFLFLASVKLAASVYNLLREVRGSQFFVIKFIRIGLLLISSVVLLSGFALPGMILNSMVLSGEFLDRISFYHDFKPLNIKSSIIEYLNKRIYEK